MFFNFIIQYDTNYFFGKFFLNTDICGIDNAHLWISIDTLWIN